MIFVSHEVEDDKLKLSVSTPMASGQTRYAFSLVNGKKEWIYQGGWQEENTFTVDKNDFDGESKYYVRVYVKIDPYYRESRLFGPFYIFSREERQSYEAFLSEENDSLSFSLPFAKYREPFQDILLVHTKAPQAEKARKAVAGLSEALGMRLTDIGGGSAEHTTLLCTELAPLVSGERAAAFSGMGKADGRLIVSMREINSFDTANALSEEIGEFSLVIKDKDKVRIEQDYFGIAKTYYFRTDTLFLCSNRMHLLLLAMEAAGLPKIPNDKKITAWLSINNQITEQNFSRELNIRGVYALPVDSKIVIDLASGRVSFQKTELYDALSTPPAYTEERYRKLLKQAMKEQLENVRVALEHPRFKKFVVHITGGLDSRVTYCLLSRFPRYRDKIVTHTFRSESDPSDWEAAMRIIAKHPFSFASPDFVEEELPPLYEMEAVSYILGTIAEYPLYSKMPYKDTCVFPGFHGEIAHRSYYTRGQFNRDLGDSTLSDGDFCHLLMEQRYLNAMYDARAEMADLLEKELPTIPGKTDLEKWENHYLYFYNGHHFAGTYRAASEAPYWGVLLSKAMLKLRCMSFSQDLGIKPQLDLIKALNPDIAKVVYAGKKDEEDRRRLNAEQGGSYPWEENCDEELLSAVKEKWEKIQEENARHKRKKINILNKDNALIALRHFIRKGLLTTEQHMALWHSLENDAEGKQKRQLYTKLISLYFELD